MRRYVLEHIQNFDKVLADWERARVEIAKKKSLFSQAGIMIMECIYDADGRHFDISKVLKIFDRLHYIGVTSACEFIGVCVYDQIWFQNFA